MRHHLCRYLYQNTQPGVQDYLCNKLFELGEDAVDRYLLQFVYLAVSRPGQPLERTIVDLCSRNFRIAIKVVWRTAARGVGWAQRRRVRRGPRRRTLAFGGARLGPGWQAFLPLLSVCRGASGLVTCTETRNHLAGPA